MSENRYVLLDRDGVINRESVDFIKSPEEWFPLDGSLEAIALLNEHGYKVVVVTNQSGVARGLLDAAMLEKIHAKMQHMTEEKGGKIHAIYFCPHGPDDDCVCRKPKPGLLEAFADDNHVSLSGMASIGDSLRDLESAQAVGASPMLVKTGNGLKTLNENPNLNIPVFENLYDAAKHIIASRP